LAELITVDCPDAKLSGFTVDGTFAQYVVSHVLQSSRTDFHLSSPFQVSYLQHVTPIPDGIDSFDAASILCAVSI
jgi:propanol-preferring alcohol dehydrogenase